MLSVPLWFVLINGISKSPTHVPIKCLGIQDKLGVLNNGIVYALYDYESQNNDELSFKVSDRIQVLRKGDAQEKEWWWSKLYDREGYIPRNLIGVGHLY